MYAIQRIPTTSCVSAVEGAQCGRPLPLVLQGNHGALIYDPLQLPHQQPPQYQLTTLPTRLRQIIVLLVGLLDGVLLILS